MSFPHMAAILDFPNDFHYLFSPDFFCTSLLLSKMLLQKCSQFQVCDFNTDIFTFSSSTYLISLFVCLNYQIVLQGLLKICSRIFFVKGNFLNKIKRRNNAYELFLITLNDRMSTKPKLQGHYLKIAPCYDNNVQYSTSLEYSFSFILKLIEI